VQVRTIDGTPRLVQRPVEELQRLRRDPIQVDGQPLRAESRSLGGAGVAGKALEIVAEFEPGDAETVGLNVRAGGDENTTIGYDTADQTVFVDRTASGTSDFHEDFTARDEAPLALHNGRVKLRVLVDWSSVEVFANDGARVLTHRIFPAPSSDGVSVFAERGSAQLTRLDAWPLQSIWAE
jgi:fructan beta-fructosidase